MRPSREITIAVSALTMCLVVLSGCRAGSGSASTLRIGQAVHRSPTTPAARNIYSAAGSGQIRPDLAAIPPRVFVPNSLDGTVDVIDPSTFRVVARFRTGRTPHHITPSWNLSWLYVDNTGSSSLTEIDPAESVPARTIAVSDPYNLYFTLDGRMAIVVAERRHSLDFRDPHTWKLLGHLRIPWPGVDHLDFSADGSYLLATTEYSGVVVKVDTRTMRVSGHLAVGGLPVDVRLSPDGSVFFVANQGRNGVSVIDPAAMKEIAFLHTGRGAHGLVVSRDAHRLYVSNRLAGTISVIDPSARQVVATWSVGGSPDMMQISANGAQLWVTNRFHRSVSVIDTRTGRILRVIAVGRGPHGLTYFPQPGRFSLGHNGVYR